MRRGVGRYSFLCEAVEDRRLLSAVPAGFSEAVVASNLQSPSAMVAAPDGRVFVAEQAGVVKVVKNGALLASPLLSVNANSEGERGLLGITLDPAFASNGFVYVFYTTPDSSDAHNRVSRFTVSGDSAVAGSEVVLLEMPSTINHFHMGGGLAFGPDGMLYIASGENTGSANAQDLSNLKGKILRIAPDGSIPADNPFYNTLSGDLRAIWAYGLRNPYTLAFQRSTGRLFINDVGDKAFEEIDEGAAGANYGWPNSEGPTNEPGITPPIYAYPGESVGQEVCIIGGAFYEGTAQQFPATYTGKYFFADYSQGFIHTIDPQTRAVSDFATGIAFPTALTLGPDGTMYYLARGADSGGQPTTGTLNQIRFNETQTPTPTPTNLPPTVDIFRPDAGTTFVGGQTISVTGTANDPETGLLTGAALNWHVVLHHGEQLQSIANGNGASIAFTTLNAGTDPGDFYRVELVATDPGGETRRSTLDFTPVVASLTLASDPPGINVRLDGFGFVTAGTAVSAVAGTVRNLSALTEVTKDGVDYAFDSWSDGVGDVNRLLSFPATDTTLVARYRPKATAPGDDPDAIPPGTVYEAEKAKGVGTTKVKVKSSFTGSGFASFDAAGESVTWSQTVAKGGTYPVVVRYAHGESAPLPVTLDSNGATLSTASLKSTGNWQTWKTATVRVVLTTGQNNVRLALGAGAAGTLFVDSIKLNRATLEAETAPTITGATVITNPPAPSGNSFVQFRTARPKAGIIPSIELTLTAPAAGTYRLYVRYANGLSSGELFNTWQGPFPLNPTGGWSTWRNAPMSVSLQAGTQKLKIAAPGPTPVVIDAIVLGPALG